VLLFVRSGETTPLFNHGRSSYGASHRRFQVLQAVQVAGILLKRILQEPYKTFRCDVEAVVVLLREVRRNHHSSTMAVRVTVQATDAFKYCKLRFR
jgi:hypothetical protein